MRYRCFHFALLIVSIASSFAGAAEPTQREQTFKAKVQPLLKQYCFSCHGNDLTEADLSLQEYNSPRQILEGHRTWLKVLAKIESGKMPPKDADARPTDAQRKMLVTWLDDLLNNIDCTGPTNPGRATIRRLNRIEYRNTIRDLLGVDYKPADDFPADDVGYGFDNIGDVLSLPPLLMEKYLAAAEEITAKAIVTKKFLPLTEKFPAAKMKATRGSSVAGNGDRILTTAGEAFVELNLPQDGQYEVRAIAYGGQAGPEPVKMAFRLDGKNQKTVEVKNSREKPMPFSHRITAKAGKRRIGVAFLNDYYRPDAPKPKDRDRNFFVVRLEIEGPINFKPPPLPAIHHRIFIAQPDKTTSRHDAARAILRRLASRAYRRPVTENELDRLLKLVALTEKQGDNFETGIQLALQAILVSPHFLYKVELPGDPTKDGGVRDLTDYELATSLSYFLWSSMPDDELLLLSRQSELRKGDNLQRQVRRMLADPKSQALVENFAGQWLNLRNLETVTPDTKRFPTFNNALRTAMRTETEMFFASIARDNRSILDLLAADYTFINEALAKHYGIAGVKGKEFRRVSLAGTPRGGVLTQASILTITSNPTRTSPVKRGKWVLDNLLGEPPPPPAANVPQLEDQKELTGTLRQQTEQHRRDPRCATCHNKMDPLGFALENFDAIGKWRTTDEKLPIDASGKLPSGEKFNGAKELQKILLQGKKEQFVRCMTEKMLTYALGRGLEYYDTCAVDEITATLKKDQYRFEALVLGIVQSTPFQRRNTKRSKP